MRILVHDYAGHPFQVQLSRRLAERGHDVLHVYSLSSHTPHGDLQRSDDDCERFHIEGIELTRMIPKTSFVRRFRLEAEYGGRLIRTCEEYQPEVVLSANCPSMAQHRLARWCRERDVRHVFWIQDLYGLAAYRLLSKRLPGIGHAIGKYFMRLDKAAAGWSDAVVPISEDFVPMLEQWHVQSERIHVIHNWAPLESLPQLPRDNAWAAEHGLGDGLRFVYSGTLSMRHNPELLLSLARFLHVRGAGELVVVSEGAAVEWLATQAAAEGIESIRFLNFQPFDRLAQVFASADVLVAILEPEAGVFCVPSKVLSYMCAGRPLLLAIPRDNLAARLVLNNGGGLVAEPASNEQFVSAAQKLVESPELRHNAGPAAESMLKQLSASNPFAIASKPCSRRNEHRHCVYMMQKALKQRLKRGLFHLYRTANRLGWHLLPDHYYASLPNIVRLENQVDQWAKPSELPGIAANPDDQLAVLREWCQPFQEEYAGNRSYHEAVQLHCGPGFGYIEAQALHGVLRSLRPQRMVEIGSGVSTYCSLQALQQNRREQQRHFELTCVEPYPSAWLSQSTDVRLISLPVQQLPVTKDNPFAALESGDLLFVDSSHTVKAGGDVNYIILEVLPRLRRGVVVHFHDIYFPYDYAPDVLKTFLHWSETSLLRAYLTHNSHARVLFCLSHLHHERPAALKEIFPDYEPQEMRDGLYARQLPAFQPPPGHFPASLYFIVE